MLEKLLKLAIMDALDRVWSETGMTPSKNTRHTIIQSAENIANDIHEDFRKADKEDILKNERWDIGIPTGHQRRTRELVDTEPDELTRDSMPMILEESN